jgi:hypothetical protein
MVTLCICEVQRVEHSTTVGSVLSFLAAGCPVCDKLVVLALGMSGAVTYFRARSAMAWWTVGVTPRLRTVGSVRTRSQVARFA